MAGRQYDEYGPGGAEVKSDNLLDYRAAAIKVSSAATTS